MNLDSLHRIATASLLKHNLAGWRLVIDYQAVRRLGQCRHKRKEIAISAHHALHDNDDEVIDMLLHEIAHALTKGEGHSDKWKDACKMIGARPEQYAVTGSFTWHPPQWIAKCSCGIISRKFRLRCRYICRHCGRQLHYSRNREYLIHRARLAFALLSESERRKFLQ